MSREYDFFVYMVSNYEGTVLYTGVTNDLYQRLWQHQTTRGGSEFTKRYHVDCLEYFEHYRAVPESIAREKQIKGWTRAKKEALVRRLNPHREDLSHRIDEFWHQASEEKLTKPLESSSSSSVPSTVEGTSARYTRSG